MYISASSFQSPELCAGLTVLSGQEATGIDREFSFEELACSHTTYPLKAWSTSSTLKGLNPLLAS